MQAAAGVVKSSRRNGNRRKVYVSVTLHFQTFEYSLLITTEAPEPPKKCKQCVSFPL